MHIDELLTKAVGLKASDIHITTGIEPRARLHGRLGRLSEQKLSAEDTMYYVRQVLDDKSMKTLQQNGEVDCSYEIKGVSRFRVNVFRQKNSCAIAFRVISDVIPSIEELGLPLILKDLAKKQRGLILVTGPTGSGKSTTLASMLDYMNQKMNRHVVTIEDPIEYLHYHKQCIMNQREVGTDTVTFANALRAALREDPDVILVGEMRDLETISTAITAAETGHLVLSTLHTIGAAKTIDRIIDAFTPEQQQQIKVQLATVIEAVISQQILPRSDAKGRVAALEVMLANSAIRNLIREGKTHQIQTMIQTGSAEQMVTMDNSLLELYHRRVIDMRTLTQYAVDIDYIHGQVG